MTGVPRIGLPGGLLLLALCPASGEPGAGTLAPLPPMDAARAVHSASALPDGSVLIAGGMSAEGSPVAGAQRFDPRTRRFEPTGVMHTRRYSHSATVLLDGRVLLAGGFDATGTRLAGAELYDPAAGTFTLTGPLLAPRADQVAVLLANGSVLVMGGTGPGYTFLASAELYDPGTGRFTATGAMSVARESHVGVRLRDGRVLVAGGHRGRHAQLVLYASAEVYDPGTGTFAATGPMTIPRHKHDGVLLPDGRVLINGGADQRDNEGTLRSTEIYDPATGRFTAGPEMHLARYKHRGTSLLLPSGQVLIAGGAPQAEVFDPAARRFSVVAGDARMPGQFSAAAPLPGGGALVTGGYGQGRGSTDHAWHYTPP